MHIGGLKCMLVPIFALNDYTPTLIAFLSYPKVYPNPILETSGWNAL